MSFTSEKLVVKNILNSHQVGESTTEEETSKITSFFRVYHPEWYSKTNGMKVIKYAIRAENTYRYNGKCFYLVTEDGTENDIGYSKLKAHPLEMKKYMHDNIAAACRYAIEEPCIKPIKRAVMEKLNLGIEVKSEYSGKPITSKTGFQIDHFNVDFETLVNEWISNKGLEFLFSKINMGENNSTITKFIDDNISKEFIVYHDKKTHLRVVTRDENLSLIKKEEKESV